MALFALFTALFTLIGLIQLGIGTLLVERFAASAAPAPKNLAPVSVLKPLCGIDPLTELALESFFLIDYEPMQLVFGIQDAADPVRAILDRLCARYPVRDIAIVIDPALHGTNRKVSNLINMMRAVKYDVLVMSDADIHVPVYFLNRVLSAMERPNTGLVTTLYTALPGTPHLATLLGSNQINYNFLPGALLARKLGRQDCLGVTMAIARKNLEVIGGLEALANHLADDQVMGRLIRAHGMEVALAAVIPATTVPEADFAALYTHELRWARTIRALVPLPYATSILQLSLFWALLCLVLSGFSTGAFILLGITLFARFLSARRIDNTLKLAKSGDAWLFLLRDLWSAYIYAASYAGDQVNWRGQTMRADPGKSNTTTKSKSAAPPAGNVLEKRVS